MIRKFHPKQGGKENIQTVKSINVVLPFPFPLRNIFMNVIYKLYLYKKEHEVNKSNQVLLPSDSLPPKEFLQNPNTPKLSNSGKKRRSIINSDIIASKRLKYISYFETEASDERSVSNTDSNILPSQKNKWSNRCFLKIPDKGYSIMQLISKSTRTHC